MLAKNRLLFVTISLLLFACRKPENQVDNPQYKMLVGHSWQSDSSISLSGATATTARSTPDNYEVLSFTSLYCTFNTYTGGQASSSIKYSFGFRSPQINFFPAEDGEGSGYSNIIQETDSILVLERHAYLDTVAPVVTTYYHAQ